MKVWFIASWWPTRVHPTHGNFVEKHARAVARHLNLTVLTVQDDPHLRFGQFETAITDRLGFREIIVYYGKGRLGRLSLLCRSAAYLTAIVSAAKLGLPELFHGHVILDGGVVAALLSRVWKRPLLLTEHSTRYVIDGGISWPRSVLARWACRQAALILPVSEYLGRCMRNQYGITGSYEVVTNVVDAGTFTLGTEKVQKDSAPFQVLHVSNFKDVQKNMEGMLRAFARAAQLQPGAFHFTIAGDGNPEVVRNVALRVGLREGAYTVSGPHDEEQIGGLMAAADVFVLFSNYETQGVVLLEALSCGLPCIATNTGPIAEIITDGHNGFLIETGDETALVEALLRMRNETTLHSPAAIREQAIVRYSESTVGRKLMHCYSYLAKQ